MKKNQNEDQRQYQQQAENDISSSSKDLNEDLLRIDSSGIFSEILDVQSALNEKESALGETKQIEIISQLSCANEIQARCAQVGFDWDALSPVVAKVKEELQEVMEEVDQPNIDATRMQEEIGDLLFATVNLSRHLKVDPELALKEANLKFMRRFTQVETLLLEQGKTLMQSNLDEMEALWQQVKNQEKIKNQTH